jgi:HEAT repeat protein
VFSASPYLEQALHDRDDKVWSEAAIGLAKLREPPALSYLENLLEMSIYDNCCSRLDACEGFITHSEEGMFEIFMRYLHPYDSNSSKVFEMLGVALRDHQQALATLLLPHETVNIWQQAAFIQGIARYAGSEILLTLHKALKSEDRIVRSNAARGCGAVGDSSSIPFLLEALELESGLSRASIVWALGEMKARDALPRLRTLYLDIRSDQARNGGAGFRSSQSGAAIQSQYDNLDAVAVDWNVLEFSDRPRPVDPARDEELLNVRHIFEAVSKIGPEFSQDFYRQLAGEKFSDSRIEAAIYLSKGHEIDRERNIPILRTLLAETGFQVRLNAAVSLFLMGENGTLQDLLRKDLESFDTSPRQQEILTAFQRIKDTDKLALFQEQLRQLANMEESRYSIMNQARRWAEDMLNKREPDK